MTDTIVARNAEASRYEIQLDGEVAGYTEYHDHGRVRSFRHTVIDERFKGRHLGGVLISRALDDTRADGLGVVPVCPFVRAYIAGHPEYLDLVDPARRARFGLQA